jgi:hypothetical protein
MMAFCVSRGWKEAHQQCATSSPKPKRGSGSIARRKREGTYKPKLTAEQIREQRAKEERDAYKRYDLTREKKR